MSRWTGWTPIDVTGLDASLAPMGSGRGAELHLGTIIKRMKIAAGENVGDLPGEQPWLRATTGFIWEAAVEYVLGGLSIDDALELAFKRHMRALRANFVRQVRLARDEIHMTPDGVELRYRPGEFVAVVRPGEIPIEGKAIVSWKATWRGAAKAGYGNPDLDEGLRDFEDNFWSWHVAEKAYAAAAQVAGLLPEGEATCRFEVLWVRGDYRGAGGPKALACEVTWEKSELGSNWANVLVNRARMGA